MGGVCDDINHFGSHIKDIGLWKAWGATMLKGRRENTVWMGGGGGGSEYVHMNSKINNFTSELSSPKNLNFACSALATTRQSFNEGR